MNKNEKATIPDIQDGFVFLVGFLVVYLVVCFRKGVVLSIYKAGALNAGVCDSCFIVGFKKEFEEVKKSRAKPERANCISLFSMDLQVFSCKQYQTYFYRHAWLSKGTERKRLRL
ncbi:MAG: hypothetical protein AB8G77_24375 [Rhodothermales bacterium]